MVKVSQSKNIGIPNISLPESVCNDKYCPFHGKLKVRGMIFEGKIIKLRANKTGVFEKSHIHYNTKYKRYERRRSRIHVHVPPCLNLKEGDNVIIAECRPIAKSVSYVVVGKVGGA
ncbi:30S ribosomal protein S17 [Acidianus brierleyi]|uniref:30S ribosomal protein S17 n=1 Tax=Acidianus brierleyi TaxID=41673 RepID=UPI001FE9CE38|nr:30S ribosomal protein S17 [Acidianus brierleyi]